jgi:hypothetical protein
VNLGQVARRRPERGGKPGDGKMTNPRNGLT